MEIYVIYYNPSDYPDKYVLRRQIAGRGTIAIDPKPICVVDTLEEARWNVPPFLFNAGRQEGDAPVIYEVWI